MTSKRPFISVDLGKCIGCSICEYVCALEKEGSFNPLRSRIRVLRLNPLISVAITCRFCEDAPCVHACPRNALRQSEENGVILIDETKCDACGWCIEACDYGAIMLNPERRVAMVCDLCGGEPKCIEFCPEEALELVTEDIARKVWASSIEKLLMEAKRLTELIRNRAWADVFAEADKKLERLEKKLTELSRRELELYTSS